MIHIPELSTKPQLIPRIQFLGNPNYLGKMWHPTNLDPNDLCAYEELEIPPLMVSFNNANLSPNVGAIPTARPLSPKSLESASQKAQNSEIIPPSGHLSNEQPFPGNCSNQKTESITFFYQTYLIIIL